ncbi:MAG: hypothetical protein R3A47_09720 [Polyangiales bacterium]
MTAITGKSRSATAEAIQDSVLLKNLVDKLEQIIASEPHVTVQLLRSLVHRIEAANRTIDMLMNGNPSARVIHGLLAAARTAKSNVVAVDTVALAAQLGITLTEDCAALRRLARVGLVREAATGVEIADEAELRAFLSHLNNQRFEVE